ncbi:MAG: phenylpyruvate tautomerase MIF-related protein [Candidatus Thiodiazotropha sp.]
MPYLLIRTNRPLQQQEREILLQKASAGIAEALGKPERYVMVSLETERDMLFAGEASPCAYLELKSIGLPGGRTTELSSTLTTLIGSELDIPADRIYIEFADAERHMWGWNGGTF